MFKFDVSQKPSVKSIYIWNSLGSLCNAMSSVLFLLVITRIMGNIQGGIFSIAFAIAQQMWSIGSFELTTFQVTDINNKYSIGIYNSTKILLCSIAIIIGSMIAMLRNYDLYKYSVVILMCVFKAIDAYSGYYFSIFQKKERLDLAGKSLVFRIVLSFVSFCICLVGFKSLLIAILIMIIINVFWVLLVDLRVSSKIEKICIEFSIKKILKLIIECFPLFLGSFIIISMMNQPKYAIDSLYSSDIQNYFGILIMPAAIINLLSLFMLRPMILRLSILWDQKNKKEIVFHISKLLVRILAITFICIIGAYVIGIPILSVVFNVDLSDYRISLCIILLGGGISAVITALYNMLAIMRKQKQMLGVYIIGFIFTILISEPLVRRKEIFGASLSYLFSMLVLVMLLIILVCKALFFDTKKLSAEVNQLK